MSDREAEEKCGNSSTPDDGITLTDDHASPDVDKEQLSTPDDETHYLTGAKLFLVMAGVTVVMLLAMLDISIVSTVSWGFLHPLGDGY